MLPLTPRESELLKYLLTPKTIKSIAWELKISQGTVSVLALRIYKKYDVETRLELIFKVFDLSTSMEDKKTTARV